MKYSPIAPIALLQDLHSHDLLGDYHLVLAHDILAHPDEYSELFDSLRSKHETLFVILDNSMIELGHPLNQIELHKAARIVEADCIVIPDVMGDALSTLKAGWKFYNDHKHYSCSRSIPFMAVPHGITIESHVLCARLLRQIPNVKYWGIPRCIANEFGTRQVDALMKELGYGKHYNGVDNVHMLGMSKHFMDDIESASLKGVMGIDSANPLVLGQKNCSLNESDRHGPRGDYWTHTKATQSTLGNIAIVRELLGA